MVLLLDGVVELDEALFELRREGAAVPLEPQAFDVLVHLVRHRDRVVTKEELMDAVWGGRFVAAVDDAGPVPVAARPAPPAYTAFPTRSQLNGVPGHLAPVRYTTSDG